MLGRRTTMAALALAVTMTLVSCSSGSGVPKGFPQDFPVPSGRVISVNEQAAAGTSEFTVEATLGTTEVEKWFEEKLAGTRWQAQLAQDGKPFTRMDPADTATYTDGGRTVKLLVTDLGNTTKVTLTASGR